MLKNNRDKFEEYCIDKEISKGQYEVFCVIYRKLENWEKHLGKELKYLDKKDLVHMFETGDRIKECKLKTGSYETVYNRLNSLNFILEFAGNNNRVYFDNINFVSEDTEKIFTKSEVIDICNALVNPSDKFIIYMFFLGAYNSQCENLRLLKEEDINLNTRTIKLPSGKTIEIDDYLYEIIIDVFETKIYVRNTDDAENLRYENFQFNKNSEYVLKTKPEPKTDDGLLPLSYSGLRDRLSSLSNVTDKKLAPAGLNKSGIIHNMLEIQERWTVSEISNYLKEKNLKGKAAVYHRIMQFKYGMEIN